MCLNSAAVYWQGMHLIWFLTDIHTLEILLPRGNSSSSSKGSGGNEHTDGEGKQILLSSLSSLQKKNTSTEESMQESNMHTSLQLLEIPRE